MSSIDANVFTASDTDYQPTYESDSDADMESEDVVEEAEVPLPNEPKYIVFVSQLRVLLKQWCRCEDCNSSELTWDFSNVGSMVEVQYKCKPCSKTSKWQSQPYLGSIPAGNLLLSAPSSSLVRHPPRCCGYYPTWG